MPNFCYRVEKELANSLIRRHGAIIGKEKIESGIKVKLVKNPQLSAWYGCQMVSKLDSFENCWITGNDYDEYGHNIFFRKCNHQDL